MEVKGLLTCIAVSNDMEYDDNFNGNITIQVERMNTTNENTSYSYSGRPLGGMSTIPVNGITPFDTYGASAAVPLSINPSESRESIDVMANTSINLYDTAYYENISGNNPLQSLDYTTHGDMYSYSVERPGDNISLGPIDNSLIVDSLKMPENITPWTSYPLHSIDSANYMPSTSSNQYVSEIQSHSPINQFNSISEYNNYQGDLDNELNIPIPIDQVYSIESANFLPSASSLRCISDDQKISSVILFKSYIQNINSQEDIDNDLCLPLSYQFMFDKRTSPWEMKNWDQDDLNAFVIQPEKIDRLYHIAANDEDPNFRSWELCCRMDYKGEKYFVEMYANCDYTGFDCQGGGHICVTKLADFFLSNMVTNDQNPEQIFKALLKDGYNVQEPDPLHKMHPKFWNNTPMLKYLCHNAIYENKDALPHFKETLPHILANSVDDFIQVKEWENE